MGIRFYKEPKLKSPVMVVGWPGIGNIGLIAVDTLRSTAEAEEFGEIVGRIAPTVIDFLNEKLGGQRFCNIEPDGFFSLGGVAVEDDCIQFPESTFFYGQRKNLVIFKSDQPNHDHYKFLNLLLDVLGRYGQIKELYTINGMVSQIAHTVPRRIFAVFNHPKFQEILQIYNLEGLTWEGPPAIS